MKLLRNASNSAAAHSSASSGKARRSVPARACTNRSDNMLIALGAALGISIDELLGLSGSFQPAGVILSPAEKILLESYQSLDQYGKKAVDAICAIEKERMNALQKTSQPWIIDKKKAVKARERYLPHYTTPSAAGISVPLDGADFEMMLIDDTIPEDADYAVDIQGDSMEPYIHDGEMVFVKKGAELMVGDVGIFCVNGAMYCKQYYLDGENNLILVSANPDLRHTNIFISADSDNSVTTCGKVLLGRRIKLPGYLFEED